MKCITNTVAPIFPVEIIHKILLLHCSPNELIPLRTVSKLFRDIIDDPTFWRTICADAHLPRPPGPFPWQSTKFLQRTLVQSARLAQCWTSLPLKIISKRSLQAPRGSSRWVSERWLFTCIKRKQLVSHDLNTGHEQTLYQSDEWASWSATSCLRSTRGHLVYVVFCTEYGPSRHKVRLLEFQADDDSGRLSGPVIFDVPVSTGGGYNEYLEVKSGDTPFVLISVILLRG
ncbi:hypothetical protein OG21DRAFT_90322 [Imleria badia]|nr:hypothetical protein OG21DRAFT_90322 [Imleria badia]